MAVGTWDLAQIIIKAIMYGSTFGAAGGVLFLWYFGEQLSAARRRAIRRSIGGFALVGVLVTAGRIPVLAGSADGDVAGMIDRPLLGMMMQGADGRSSGIRIIGLALTCAVFRRTRWVPCVTRTGAVLAATSFVWVGHARGATPVALTMSLLALHLLGVAFWLGALLPLLTIVRSTDPSCSGSVLARFGRSAGVAVCALLIAGLLLLWMLIGTPTRLWSSDYGRLFLVKLCLVTCLSALAALNKWRLTPALQQRDTGSVARMQSSIAAEVAIAILILLVTAAFTTLTGP